MNVIYMLDTNICSFIMRERPPAVLNRLQAVVEQQSGVVISVITYYEMLLGVTGKNASPRLAGTRRSLSAILPWDRASAEESTGIRKDLAANGKPIGGNDAMIAGHALVADCVLVTNTMRELSRVRNLRVEDWVAA